MKHLQTYLRVAAALCLLPALALSACEDEGAPGPLILGADLGARPSQDAGGTPAEDGGLDPDLGAAPTEDAGGPGLDAAQPSWDLGGPAEDARAPLEDGGLDAAPADPDGGAPREDQGGLDQDAGGGGDLTGELCDPRLNSQACGPGYVCQHEAGQAVHIGRCEAGEQCSPLDPTSCPDPARPVCQLHGAATFCAPAGEVPEGGRCISEAGALLPCAEGLVCNQSVCQRACDPANDEPDCPLGGRCADVSAATGVEGFGLCAPRGCNWFTDEGCDAQQRCNLVFQDNVRVVGACLPAHGERAEREACSYVAGGGHDCAQGLHCLQVAADTMACVRLCDVSMLEAPCGAHQTCREAFGLPGGIVIDSYGICMVNP